MSGPSSRPGDSPLRFAHGLAFSVARLVAGVENRVELALELRLRELPRRVTLLECLDSVGGLVPVAEGDPPREHPARVRHENGPDGQPRTRGRHDTGDSE